ncbi:LOG family protein [Phototrophicus methaneseepsis]|uniref:LOG family protein n=1 Tax=Phototrophicus methaneseepsis TaxID=2710758 RepID=A0A7S8E840_9CHLR|nr:LOG family protein [Phototrophicus methaneseepsis]QPC82067.1 LOG family protein [Phototrophicus methaneseepsis]
MKTIAVFGSAVVIPSAPEYFAAVAMGKALAEAGYAVMTGGYEGIMGAVSKGAAEVGGEVVGVTVGASAQLAERVPNPWLTQCIEHPTMRLRLHHLVDEADGYVVMPGGIGTLQEVGEAWQHLRACGQRKPMVAYGPLWRQVLQPLKDCDYVPSELADMLVFCNTTEDTLAVINAVLGTNEVEAS